MFFALIFNVFDCVLFIIFWNLVKKWRKKYLEENSKQDFLDLFNETKFNKIIVYDPAGIENINLKKYLIGPLIYFSLAINKISKKKISDDKKIKDKIYTFFIKHFFINKKH